jgi:hypothetical protein
MATAYIDDDGATVLAQALQVNISLQKLWLRSNKIGYNGVAELA